MTRTLSLITLLAAGGLSACQINRVVPDPNPDFYSPTEISVAFSNRNARVKIDGNPFTVDQYDFETTIVGYMQAAWHRVPTNLTTTPDASVNDTYKIVLVFNPVETLTRETFCGDTPIATAAPDPQQVVIRAAFCRHANPAVTVRGYGYDFQGPGDPALRSLIGDVVRALFPINNPELRNNDNDSGGVWMN